MSEEQEQEKNIEIIEEVKKRHITFSFWEVSGIPQIEITSSLKDKEFTEFYAICRDNFLITSLLLDWAKKNHEKMYQTLVKAEELLDKKFKKQNLVSTSSPMVNVLLNETNSSNFGKKSQEIKNKILFWEELNIETDITDGLVKEIDDLEEYEDGDPEQEFMTSPFGLFKIKDFFNPMKQYQWYMCNTNFDITLNIALEIAQVVGVEKMLVLSRYKFLVAFGKVFDHDQVKALIGKHFKASLPLSVEAKAKIKDLQSLYEKWVVYYLNEKFEYATEDEYDSKIKSLIKKQKDFGGILVTHEDNI